MNKRSLGKDKEARAIRHLEENGYEIVATNFWCRLGEIDVVAKEGGYYVFVEVKYRRTSDQGHPTEALTPRKMGTITQVARWYMLKNGISEDQPCRFDVVSLLGDEASIIKNAFEAVGCV